MFVFIVIKGILSTFLSPKIPFNKFFCRQVTVEPQLLVLPWNLPSLETKLMLRRMEPRCLLFWLFPFRPLRFVGRDVESFLKVMSLYHESFTVPLKRSVINMNTLAMQRWQCLWNALWVIMIYSDVIQYQMTHPKLNVREAIQKSAQSHCLLRREGINLKT